jgi:coenzyme F420-0:L-glutamate ligase / coenzyme F420-1:gamma-L-glutamate ligase
MTDSLALQILPLRGLPEVRRGADLPALVHAAGGVHGGLRAGDVVVFAQKIISKAEGRRVRLADVMPSARAAKLAQICRKDPRLVELVLRESTSVVRCAPDVLIVQDVRGFTVANAGIDQSNIEDGDNYALMLPENPDLSAGTLRAAFSQRFGLDLAVVINDSFGRPWRRGTCGVAIGCAGLPALLDLRGRADRFGRTLKTSELAFADEIAAAASLAMGQAAEGVPAVLIRGVKLEGAPSPAATLLRSTSENLFK